MLRKLKEIMNKELKEARRMMCQQIENRNKDIEIIKRNQGLPWWRSG